MSNFTLLEKNDIYGLDRLNIFEYNKVDAVLSDFAAILGCNSFVGANDCLYGEWLTSTKDDEDIVCVSYIDNNAELSKVDNLHSNLYGLRIAVPYYYLSFSNIKGTYGIKEGLCGVYPQGRVKDESLIKELENNYINHKLKKTNKTYSYNASDEVYPTFIVDEFIEYEYNGKKYIRVVPNKEKLTNSNVFSDKSLISSKDYYWIKVEPIEWLLDEEKDIALTKKILTSNIFYCHYLNNVSYCNNSYIDDFLNVYFAKDMLVENITKKYNNSYNFNYDEVSEEDIIKGCIKSDVAVFLHGKSGDGKSSRVKQLDPDLEILYLRNATPDSLNGKCVYNPSTNELVDIEPTWYKNLVKKCEEEPNKIHILFFDELTNALPSIQAMAFNIILDKEVNGKFKLPKNVRIVAAGNDLDDSLAANNLAEPLFNRFAHVYINTNAKSWLNWTLTSSDSYERLDYEEVEKNKIHPSIYAYIAYNNKALRTPFNGQKPNADPRKWEMASRVLYQTNQVEMLRALVGEDVTIDFIEFSKSNIITLEDVLNNNYDPSLIDLLNTSQKYATALNLSKVDDENFEKVDEFMKLLGSEAKATFESMWASNNEKRLSIIQEIRLQDEIEKEENYKKLVKRIMNVRNIPYKGDN